MPTGISRIKLTKKVFVDILHEFCEKKLLARDFYNFYDRNWADTREKREHIEKSVCFARLPWQAQLKLVHRDVVDFAQASII